MTALRKLFPNGEADDLNIILFSTSGVHGSCYTIEDVEKNLQKQETVRDKGIQRITFIVIHPRICCLKYGLVEPRNQADIDF